jgi:hypothetical protein
MLSFSLCRPSRITTNEDGHSSSTSTRVGIEYCLRSSGCVSASSLSLFSHQSAYQPRPDLDLSFRPPATPSDSFRLPSDPFRIASRDPCCRVLLNRSPTTDCVRGFSQPAHAADTRAPQVLEDRSREALRAFAHTCLVSLSAGRVA